MPLLALLFACKKDVAEDPVDAGVRVVDNADGAHLFDQPFPSDALRTADGGVDLGRFPASPTTPLGSVIDAWVVRTEQATRGFCANCPAFFQFEGPLDVPATTEGTPDDPVLLIDLDTAALFPVELTFYDEALDDPYLTDDLLRILPAVGHTPPSGARLAAVVMTDAGAKAADVGADVLDALDRAGVSGTAAVATTYTLQDSTAQLAALAKVSRGAMIPGQTPTFRRVTQLEYIDQDPGVLQIVTYDDDTTRETLLAGSTDQVVDLEDWPLTVYEAEIELPYLQGFDGQPWMRPGALHLLDVDDFGGWYATDADGAAMHPGTVDQDTVRIVVSVPKTGADHPVVVWDHGTSGTAYNSVQRKNVDDDGRAVAQAFADAGVVVVGHDQPFYGARYPLVDEGYTDGSLGFYNIVNLPAFRDNTRQGGIEGLLVRDWLVSGGLDAIATVDTDDVRHFGHSLGAATANNGLAADPDAWTSGFVSGSGAIYAFSFLETGLAGTSGGLFETLEDLFGVEVGEDDDLGVVIGAGLEMGPEAAARVDRGHPAVMLFQWIVDPSDPAAFAHDETLPVTVFMGIDDLQIPNIGTRGLAELLPEGELVECTAQGDYDAHYCIYREDAGNEALRTWLGL